MARKCPNCGFRIAGRAIQGVKRSTGKDSAAHRPPWDTRYLWPYRQPSHWMDRWRREIWKEPE